jgi:glycosyltransferase involved in cell wall biosynthesis
MKSISVALISSSVAKTPYDPCYSFVFDEIHRLANRGSNVHVIRSFQEAESTSYSIHYHGLDNTRRVKHIPYLFKHLNLIPRMGYTLPPWTLLYLSKYAQAVARVTCYQSLDLIHAHCAYPEGFIGLLAKKETGRPLVVTVHGADVLVEPSIGYGVRLSKRYDALVKRVLLSADAVITASGVVFVEVCNIIDDVEKVNLIPYGIDTKSFNPNVDCSHLKNKLGIKGRIVIFAIRSHEPKYGLEYLIRAASIVTKQTNKVLFVIGGDGSLRYFHEKLATELGLREKIIFTGKIPRNEVPSYYALSDIVVVPSIQEAFGLTVSEAMACGKPVIGTNVGGIPDQISDGHNGFLVASRNPSEIAEKICWLVENLHEAKRMGLNGRKIVEEKFDINKKIDTLISLYETLISNHRKAL